MNIYLIGMPGCGKSSIGIALSKLINYELIDLDKYIENKSDLSISSIFELYGEQRFRALEKEALNDFMSKDNYIISCGGGIIGDLSNKSLMNGKVVFIDVDINLLKERIANDKVNIRPMFKTKTVEQLYSERIEKYNYFMDVKVNNYDVLESAKEIIKELGL